MRASYYRLGIKRAVIISVRFPSCHFPSHVLRGESLMLHKRLIDVGGSQAIIDGRIKLKSSGQISRFTKNGLLFDDGSTLDADVVIFATG